MKKSLLRFFALLLTLTVSVSVFVGCGGAYFDAELTNKLSYSQLSNYKPQGDMTLYVVRKSL